MGSEMCIRDSSQGQYFIDGAFRQLEQVEQILQRARNNNPLSQSVVIRADKKADWDHVALAMNLCKKVGIEEFTATTDEP